MRFTATGKIPPPAWDAFQKQVTRYAKTELRGHEVLAIKTLRGDIAGGMLQATVVIEVAAASVDEDEFAMSCDEVAGQAIVKSGGKPGPQSVEVIDHRPRRLGAGAVHSEPPGS
ncbi:hypothetical protein [Microbacterium sp.]|uniref:hypothetical protein n=1 Tax=Microbacterium sp. TaxID=51671 RepID=UPI00324203D3